MPGYREDNSGVVALLLVVVVLLVGGFLFYQLGNDDADRLPTEFGERGYAVDDRLDDAPANEPAAEPTPSE